MKRSNNNILFSGSAEEPTHVRVTAFGLWYVPQTFPGVDVIGPTYSVIRVLEMAGTDVSLYASV